MIAAGNYAIGVGLALTCSRGYEKNQMKVLRQYVATIKGRVKRNEV
jgi:hypothetical protein